MVLMRAMAVVVGARRGQAGQAGQRGRGAAALRRPLLAAHMLSWSCAHRDSGRPGMAAAKGRMVARIVCSVGAALCWMPIWARFESGVRLVHDRRRQLQCAHVCLQVACMSPVPAPTYSLSMPLDVLDLRIMAAMAALAAYLHPPSIHTYYYIHIHYTTLAHALHLHLHRLHTPIQARRRHAFCAPALLLLSLV